MTAAPVDLPTSPPSPAFTRSRGLHNRAARIMNRLVIAFCCMCALVAILALFLILGYFIFKGASSLQWRFFTQLPANGGFRNGIEGSLVLIALASCVGIPLGMLCGIYLAEYAGQTTFSHSIRLVVDVLAGVPSILVGVLAYELVVVPMGHNSAWAGAVALGFMMCPIIARTTEEMLRLVPNALREASIGIGASKFQTLFRVVIPAASSGIITGIMLALARIAGETAPLLFTAMNSDQPVFFFNSAFPFFHADLNHAFPSLTVKIFILYEDQSPDAINQLWAGMFILITLILILNLTVRYVSRAKTHGQSH